jgi:hypothetical protein
MSYFHFYFTQVLSQSPKSATTTLDIRHFSEPSDSIFQKETHAYRSNTLLRARARCFHVVDDRLQQGSQHRFELQI